MKVGELIDALEPFRGRGDDVVIEDEADWIYNIEGVYWDDIAKVVTVAVTFVG